MNEKIAIICIVNMALYLKTLRFKFMSDDFSVWQNPPPFKNNWHRRWLQFMGSRKIYNNTYVPFWKGRPRLAIFKTEEQEHLLALTLHTLLCVGIYFAFGRNDISFIAALLYSVNPVNNQGTIWPGGRGYVYPALGLVITLAVPYLAPLALFFGMSFTVGFLAPLALIGHSSWFVLACILVMWLIHSRKFRTAVRSKAGSEQFTEDRRFHWGKLVLAAKTLGFYLTLCIVPFKITFYHNILQSCAGNEIMRKRAYRLDGFFWLGLVTCLGWIAYSLYRWDNLAWAMFAFIITIGPFCNLRRANQEIAERFAALPNVFLTYFVAQLIYAYPIVVTIFLTFYATRTYYTLKLYQDDYWVTECAVVEDDKAWWAWHCRAMKRWDTKSYKEALTLWVMAKLLSPKEFKILMNIATVLRLLHNDKEADEYLKLAAENIVEGQEEDSKRFIREHKAGKLPILL